jgi:hypothetical protein
MSLARRAVSDLLYASKSVPTVPFQKDMQLADLVAARQRAQPRPSWCSIFTKAYAKVVASRPELRRAYLSFPLERLFEYSMTTADIVIATRLGEEDILVNLFLRNPDSCPLLEIDRLTTMHKEKPLESSRRLRGTMMLARFPRFVRRLVWWYALNGSGRVRARLFGTFAVSSVSNWGVDSVRPLSPVTTLLHYGTFDASGKVTVRLTFDHRVMDGAGPSKALNEMEHFLKTDLLAEVKGLQEGMLKAG